MRRKISILGATGSVGTSTLDLVERRLDRFEVIALTAAKKVGELADAAIRTGAKLAVIDDPALYSELERRLQGSGCKSRSAGSATRGNARNAAVRDGCPVRRPRTDACAA